MSEQITFLCWACLYPVQFYKIPCNKISEVKLCTIFSDLSTHSRLSTFLKTESVGHFIYSFLVTENLQKIIQIILFVDSSWKKLFYGRGLNKDQKK